MSRKSEEINIAASVLAEVCRAFYNHLVKLGFTRGEALELTRGYIQATMKPIINNQEEF